MKLLLDENLPQQFHRELAGHKCLTVTSLGWSGTENGALLARAALAGFHALLTMDSNLAYQQGEANLPLAVIVIRAASNKIADVRPLAPAVLAALTTLAPRSVTVVQLPGASPGSP